MADVTGGLRDDLAAAIAEVEAPEVAETEAPATEAVETEKPSVERARGPDGKFIAKDAAETPEEPAEEAPAEAAPEEPAEEKAAPEAVKTESEPLPSLTARWSAADKAMYAGLPKPAQDFMARRYGEMEADHTRKTQAIADFKRTYDPVDQMFTPFKAQMQQQGWTPAALVKAWADVERDLMGGKGDDVIARMIRDYKVDPYSIAAKLGIASAAPAGAASAAPAEQPAQFDPAVEAALRAKFNAALTPLQQQIKSLTDEANARQVTFQNQRVAEANQTLQNFIDAKLPDGAAAHPHYAAVEGDMVALARIEAQAGRVPDLNRLYDTAVWANPSTRAQLLAAQQAAQAAKAQSEARAKAVAAKKAAASVTGAPGSGQAPKATKADLSLRAQLEEAAAEHEAA